MRLLPDFGFSSVEGFLSILYLVTILFICLMIIFQNKAPVKTLSWIMVVLLLPVVGIVLYIFLGEDYRKRKIFSRKGLRNLIRISDHATLQIESIDEILKSESQAVKAKEHLVRLMLNNDKAILTRYNRVDILLDGTQTFPAMLESIRSAKRYIHMQFYRFEFDELGREFLLALKEKAMSGVEVRIMFDDVGSWNFPYATIKEMKSCGVEIFPFLPVRFPFFTSKINYRNHRKIMVVDGDHGYIGGLNLARKYLFGLKELGRWRDTHLRISGEAVSALNSVFLTDWFFVTGIILTNEPEYFTGARHAGNSLIQITSSGPDSDWASIMQVYFSAIATARESIFISTPYFSPDDSLRTALITSALSGVDVRLLVPERSDSIIATWNTRSYISELLEAGVKVYLYGKGFNHSKYMIVDNVFTAVGSANFDIRSFDLNFEVMALVYDEGFAGDMIKVFEKDIEGTRLVSPAGWEQRKRSWRYRESLARILGPLY